MAYKEEEISLKEIILKLKEWFRYLLSKWLWLCIAGMLCGSIAMIYVWLSKPKYTASLSFILSTDTQGGGAIYGLASQFGIDLGSGGSNDAFSGDNIIVLMNSRTMVQKALLKKPPGTNETLINILAEGLKMDKEWNSKERTKGAFPFPEDPSKMTYIQDSLFRDVYEMIEKKLLAVSRPDKKISVYEVNSTSTNELFSMYLTKYLVDETSKFYIDTKTSLARQNLEMLQHEADSLRSLLSGSISSTAEAYDKTFNLNPALQVQRAPAQEGQFRINALGTAYGEVVKNLELAKINLQKATPLYQVIDEPQLPLVAEKTGRLMALIVGGLIGVFLMTLFFIMRKMITSIRGLGN